MSALGPWELVGKETRLPYFADEGLATVASPRGAGRLHSRGALSIPLRIRLGRTWVHIGDPDSHDGVVVDCYQGKPGARAKMFRAKGTSGRSREYIHSLAAGEQMNNSFVAISPDGQWMISGEWNTVHRLLIFPTPMLNSTFTSTSMELALVAELEMDQPMRNVQGAAFIDPLTILCATDDPDTGLWPVARQLLQLDLDRPLDGKSVRGRVTCLGPLPLVSRCAGTFEVEGIDYDPGSGDLRVVVVPPRPCKWTAVTIYRYRRSA